MHSYLRSGPSERDACGVGFVVTRDGVASRAVLDHALHALQCVEHRGGVLADAVTGDGSGVMTDIPWELLGIRPDENALATLFLLCEPARRQQALRVIEQTFGFFGLKVVRYRRVPTCPEVLGDLAHETLPEILHAIIAKPKFCRTEFSFERILYVAKQKTRTALHAAGYYQEVYFTSLSTRTTVYKALCRSRTLARFYPDLGSPTFRTRFALFHRRFSTNTRTSWDKAQPFRMIAHNGEINTITGNRSWSYSREQDLGLPRDELLTHESVSDSGNLNEMAEALRYRSSIPALEDVLAIMVPPAHTENAYYRFWQRAVEPWDGPAFLAYCDGSSVGARLDRNGFRPGRWSLTDKHFFLASEAGIFDVPAADVERKGALRAGTGLHVALATGEVMFRDPSESEVNRGARFEARLRALRPAPAPATTATTLGHRHLFGLTSEEVDRMLGPMMVDGLEPIGSMGDTAALAILSRERRSFFDFFYQVFAQVTNPPLDYLREKAVTDLSTTLGVRPNVFSPAELIPPAPAIRLLTPVVDLDQLEAIADLGNGEDETFLVATRLDCTYERKEGGAGLARALERLSRQATASVGSRGSILVLSDRAATVERLPVPSLLALRAVVVALNAQGLRLKCSLVVDAGDARNTHHLAALIAYGATAVCPRLPFELARYAPPKGAAKLESAAREANLRAALESGLLKIMSKMGISVVQSYQGAELFSVVGLGAEITSRYFGAAVSPVGGYGLDDLASWLGRMAPESDEVETSALPNPYLLREQASGKGGEHHGFTAAQARELHHYVQGKGAPDEAWERYKHLRASASPVSIADLLDYHPAAVPTEPDEVEGRQAILERFGAGAMSFGAISGEAQRDLIVAMRAIGGRSNSGEGGENPFYYSQGVSASTKQVASARFGVTAEYLITADEFEIKIAQGAKPGEGGQVMGVKVTAEIAKARYATPGVDLISPAPLHDIYSIEDLRELIYQLRQLKPTAPICVKLVSGHNIGTIAAGVVKAGANIIQISGGNGGTGAASLSSMRHAGLPWEIGLAEVHRVLVAQCLRDQVELRVDGGLSTARDIIIATLLGAEGFNFGKLLLGALGCIMARVCEKNTCPRGIATHDPKFKAKYVGEPEHVVRFLERIADEVREHLATIGARSLGELVGQTQFLRANRDHRGLIAERRIDLTLFTEPVAHRVSRKPAVLIDDVGELNQRIVQVVAAGAAEDGPIKARFDIKTTDRAALARLAGVRAEAVASARRAGVGAKLPALELDFYGSAGQGFATFLTEGCRVQLWGEANDSVCKSMSGGTVVVVPSADARLGEDDAIIGNCALYGATGGTLYVRGGAGDRFAVRNSGATAVVDSVGFHACEYMTGGTVVILENAGHNIGAGMTGGQLFLPTRLCEQLSGKYLASAALDESTAEALRAILAGHAEATSSPRVNAMLGNFSQVRREFSVCTPRAILARHVAAAS